MLNRPRSALLSVAVLSCFVHIGCGAGEPLLAIEPSRARVAPPALRSPSACPDFGYRELNTTAYVIAQTSDGALSIGTLPVTAALTSEIERRVPAPAGAVDLAHLPPGWAGGSPTGGSPATGPGTLVVLTRDALVLVDPLTGEHTGSLGPSDGAFTVGFDGVNVLLGRADDLILVSPDGAREVHALDIAALPELNGDTSRAVPPPLSSSQAPRLRNVVPLFGVQLMLFGTDVVPEPIVPPFDGILVSGNAPSQTSAFALLSSEGAPEFVSTFLVHALEVDDAKLFVSDIESAGSDGCHVVVAEQFEVDNDRFQTLSFHRPDRVIYAVSGPANWVREDDGTVASMQVPFEPRILSATAAWLPAR